MPKNYFSNHKAFWEAVENIETIYKWADSVQSKLGKNPDIDYDHRDLYSIAMLTVDLSNIPDNEKESYFKAEYEKIHHAFDTSDAKNPKRSDPEKVKPYIKKVFDSLTLTDLSKVDFNDPKQIEKVLCTILSTQMLSIKIENYPDVAMEVYPTHEDKMRIDALCAKAYALRVEARVEMSYAGLDDIGLRPIFNTVGHVAQKSTGQLIQADIINKVFDSNLNGNDLIMLDPNENELSTKFFMNESFAVTNDIGDGPEDFNQYHFGKAYVEHLADCVMKTAFEYQVFLPAEKNSSNMQKQDLLIINGKPLGKLLDEYQSKGYKGDDREMMAGLFLREALLKGEPVTLVTSSFTKDGEIKFHNKDIKLDLDKLDIKKLNEQDYESYHPFRKWLDKIGLWPIRPPYVTNAERDAKQAKMMANGKSAHQKKVKAIEKEFIRSYNRIDRTKNSLKGCALEIPKLTLVETEVKTPVETSVKTENVKGAETSKNNEIERMRVDLSAEFNKTENIEKEQPKSDLEKTVTIESKSK